VPLAKRKKHSLDINKLSVTSEGLLPSLEKVYLYYRSIIEAALGKDENFLDSRQNYFTQHISGHTALRHFRNWSNKHFPSVGSDGEQF
jgi:hypothetical protein